MMRVRIDGGQLTSRAAARHRRDQHRVRPGRRRRHRPAEHPAALDPHRGRPRDLASGSRRSGCTRPRPAATPRASCSAARWRASPPTRCSTPSRRDGADGRARTSATRRSRNLPRKFKTSICGCAEHCTNHEINDVSFVGVRNADGEAGLRPVGRRRAVDQPDVRPAARRVRPARAGHRGLGRRASSVFRDYGYRRSRNHARLKFLMADWGPEKFREVLQDEYLHAPLPDGPAAAPAAHDHATTSASTQQRDGGNAVGVALRAGRTSGTQLTRIADLAAEYGTAGRPGPDDGPAGAGRPRRPRRAGRGRWSPSWPSTTCGAAQRRSAAARWPAPGSSSASSRSSRPRPRQDLYAELEKRLPDFDEPISINVNGCPNSCARFQVADIGFKGSIVRDPTARASRASRCTSAASSAPRRPSAASSAASR